jgi:hypothetical protein
MARPPDQQLEARRLAHKSLHSELCRRFLRDYGYQGGRAIVPTIVDDILRLVTAYNTRHDAQRPTQILYTAAHRQDKPTRGKTIADTALQPVLLTITAPEDTDYYARHADELLMQRLDRWTKEAYQQQALLTSADLAFLAARSRKTIDSLIRKHEQNTGKLLPLRGTLHDSSPKLTHKAAIVRLHLTGLLPTEIARETGHSLEAVEHYLRHFELVRSLAQDHDPTTISRLLQCSTQLVHQYMQLLKAQSP